MGVEVGKNSLLLASVLALTPKGLKYLNQLFWKYPDLIENKNENFLVVC